MHIRLTRDALIAICETRMHRRFSTLTYLAFGSSRKLNLKLFFNSVLRMESSRMHKALIVALSLAWCFWVSVGSDVPENVAVNSGESSNLTCRTKTTSILRWSMRLFGESEVILTRDGQILPSFAGNYSVEASSGQLTLIVKNTSLHVAGKYICLELSSSKTFSAELIVIESDPVCKSTENETSSVHICDVKYRGNWRPDIDLSLRENNKADIEFNPGHLTSQLVIPEYKPLTYYACTAKFSQNGKKTFEGENVNDVIGTVARNIPEYSTTTVCNKALSIQPSATPWILLSVFAVLVGIRHDFG